MLKWYCDEYNVFTAKGRHEYMIKPASPEDTIYGKYILCIDGRKLCNADTISELKSIAESREK